MKLSILILKLMITYSLANQNNSSFNCKNIISSEFPISVSKHATQSLCIIKLSDWENIWKSKFIVSFVYPTGFMLHIAQTSFRTDAHFMCKRNTDKHNKIKEDIIKIILIKVSNLKELWKSKYIELIFFNSFVLITSKSNSNVTKNEPFNASTSLEVYAQLMYQINKEWQINQYQRVENVNKLGIFIRLKFDIINIDIKLCSSWPFEVYYFKCYIYIMYFLIFFICYQYFLLFLPLLYHFFEDFDYLLEGLITSCLYT